VQNFKAVDCDCGQSWK